MTQQTNLQSFPISVQTTDAVIKYLNGQPYAEVAHLITAIRAEYQEELARTQEVQKSTKSPKAEKAEQ